MLKTRRISGKESLSLRGTSGGTFCMPREWTDLAEPSPYIDLEVDVQVLDYERLLELTALLEEIGDSHEKGVHT